MQVKVTSKDFGYAVKFLKKNGYTFDNGTKTWLGTNNVSFLVNEGYAKAGVMVRVDYENNAELFWDTIREKHPAIAEKFQANANVFLTEEEWETVQAVEGFEDGPNYARTALRMNEMAANKVVLP